MLLVKVYVVKSELAKESVIKITLRSRSSFGCYTYDKSQDIRFQKNIARINLDEFSVLNHDKIINGFGRVLKSAKSITTPDTIVAFTVKNIYYKDLIDIYNQMFLHGFDNHLHIRDTIFIFHENLTLNRQVMGQSSIMGFPWQVRKYEFPLRMYKPTFKTIWEKYLSSFAKEHPYYFASYCLAFVGLLLFSFFMPVTWYFKDKKNPQPKLRT